MSTLAPGEDDADIVELTPIQPARQDDSARLNELLAVLSLIAFVWNLLRED